MNPGTKLRRRVPEGDAWDEIEVLGSYEMAEGAAELVVSPTEFGHGSTTVDPNGLGAYELAIPEDPGVVALRERMADLGWSTDPAELVTA